MFKWKKLGRVFDPRQASVPWLHEFAQAPATLVFEDFVRVYFSGRPAPDANGQYASYSGFVDLERKNLMNVLRVSEQPILPLGDTGTFDEFGIYPVSIQRVGRQVVAYYAGWTRCEAVAFDVAIGRATSNDDGVTFEKSGPGPILSYSPDEPFILSGPKIRRFNEQWQLWYIAGRKWIMDGDRPEPVYKIRMATSDDGIQWEKLGRDLIPSKVEENEAQASPDVFFHDGIWHMFFCYRYSTGYRSHDHGYRIGYASSRDMLHWERDDDKAGINVSESGWDSEMVAYPHVFELDGSIYMMYLGNQVGRHGFGLAVLEGGL